VTAMTERAFTPAEPISLGALVTAEEEDHVRRFFIAPLGGGLVLTDATGEITVLTPTSPIGRALLGRRIDDDCEVSAGGQVRMLTVTGVE
jgi:transcription elongation GreA/GreB family factor